MALAFKRALSEAEKAVESANNFIKDKYKTPVNPVLVADFEGIKAVEGVSKQNPNSVEGPKNITLVNWIKDNAQHFHIVWSNVLSKDKTYAVPILNQHLEKLIVHVDDKSAAGKYNSYTVEWKGKELHVTVHIDFSNYPQQLSLTDEKNGHISQQVWAHLDEVANITYEIRKATLINYQYSELNNHTKSLKEKLKKDIPIEIDWDSIYKLEGKSLEYANEPPVPNRARGVQFLEKGKGLFYVYYAIDKLVKDKMGMEAFLETFDKVHVSIAPGSTEVRSGPHEVSKDGKTLKFLFKLNIENFQNATADQSVLAKQIEALL